MDIIGGTPPLSPDLEQLLQPVTIGPSSSPAHLHQIVDDQFLTIISVAVRTVTLIKMVKSDHLYWTTHLDN